MGGGGVGSSFNRIKSFCGTRTNVEVFVEQLSVGMEIKN